MPPEPLGPCSHDGCKKQALFYCFVPKSEPGVVQIVAPIDCDQVFCEEHAIRFEVVRTSKRQRWSYYVRVCQPCLDKNRALGAKIMQLILLVVFCPILLLFYPCYMKRLKRSLEKD